MRRGLVVAILIVSGCGDGDEPASQASRPTATPTATPTEAPAARTDQACFELWNATQRPGAAGQKSPADFVAELAAKRETPVRVILNDAGECVVLARYARNPDMAYAFVALGGRAPFHQPSRINLTREVGENLRYNARAREDGALEPAG
jgi:hypothetical protein